MAVMQRGTSDGRGQDIRARKEPAKPIYAAIAKGLQRNNQMGAEVYCFGRHHIAGGSRACWVALGWNQGCSNCTNLSWTSSLGLLMLAASQISIHDQKMQAEVLDGVANLSKLICRYAVFEDVYLQDQSLLQESLKSKLTAALKALYMAMFTYLVEVISYVGRPSTGEWSYSFVTRLDN